MDRSILDNQRKVKKYLEDQAINYDPGSPPHELRGLAKARMKRIRDQSMTPAAKKALIDNLSALSVADVNEMTARIRSNAETFDKHYTVTFAFEELPSEFVKLKHTNIKGGCKGLVVNGKCTNSRCNETTAGVYIYGFKSTISQLLDDSITLTVWCGDKAGISMFGCAASDFNDLDNNAVADKVESVIGVSMNAGLIVTYDPDKDDLFLCLYNVTKNNA